jgi:hypothetical protein
MNNHEMDLLRASQPAKRSPAGDPDARFAEIVAEPGDPRLASFATLETTRSVRRWTARPRVVAGGSLGLAGLAAGLVLAFSGSTAPPAFAITHNSNASLLVHLYHVSALAAAEQQIEANDVQGTLVVTIEPGPATTPGPIECSTGDQDQQVEMLLGSDGTDVVPAGTRGAGSWHLGVCSIAPGNGGSNTGASGSNTGNTGSAAGS